MQRVRARIVNFKKRDQRGVALITTLLLLMLLSGLALAMAWSTRSDMMINGYYKNFRGSFYAADSGLNVVRQAMANQFATVANGGILPNNFAANSNPIPNGSDATIAGNLNAAYGAYTSVAVNGSVAENFKLVPPTGYPQGFNLALTSCTWSSPTNSPTQGTCLASGSALPTHAATFSYVYSYAMSTQGQSKGTENTTLFDYGTLTISANTQATSTNQSFAAWGMFIDQYSLCGGGTLVPGTITGPTFTNGSWNFGNGGKYTFTDPVGQAGSQAGYQASSCVGVAGPSGNGIAPTFQQGFALGQPTVPLPKNSFNQEQAVLDGKGVASTAPTNSQLSNPSTGVKDVKGNPYPSGGASTGVFLPYATVNGKSTFQGGGILVQGDAAVTLSTSGTAAQVYTITQGSGSSAVTTTIVMNPTPVTINGTAYPGGTTQMSSTTGGVTTTAPVISGVPQMYDPTSGSDMGYDTMLYVNGNITSISGPSSGPAIQNGTALTVTAQNNVTVTGNITYTTEPVTLTASGSTPIDTLVPAGNTGQALGIFTAAGNIDMHVASNGANLEIDASLATISQGGSGGLINTGNSINTLTIVGGRIQNTIQNIGASTRNVLFDRRYANGFAPPWFPSTSLTPTGINSALFSTPTPHRMSWSDKTTLQ